MGEDLLDNLMLCEGMTVTSGFESEFSSRTKESSKRRLNCGSERGVSPFS